MNKNNLYLAYKTKYPYINDNDHLLLDKEFIKKIIKYDPLNLKLISSELDLEDEDFLLELFVIGFNIKHNSSLYLYKLYYDVLPNNLKQNDKFLLKLIKINYKFFYRLPEDRITKNIVVKSIVLHPKLIFKLPIKYKNDKDLFLLAIKNNIKFNTDYFYPDYLLDEEYEKYKIFYEHVKNNLDVKFKLYNYLLNNGEIINYNCIKPFINFRRFDFLNFFKKNNGSTYYFTNQICILNPKFIIKINNINILSDLTKNFGKKNIFYYLSQIKFKNNDIQYCYDINFFKLVTRIFDNKNDIIISLIKLNELVLYFVKKNTYSNKKYVIKAMLKQNIVLKNSELSYKLKYKYHENYFFDINKNINHLFYFSNKYKKTKKIRIFKKIINSFTTILNKKLMNKLLYFNNYQIKKSLDYYYNLKLSSFLIDIRNIISQNLDIMKLFCKNNNHNIKFLNEDLFTKENILHLIKSGCKIFSFLSDELKNDEEIIYHSLKIDIKQLKYVNNINFINVLVYNNFNLEKTYHSLKFNYWVK